MTRWLLAIVALTSLVDFSQSIDLELSAVTCDESLPIFANNVGMTCNGATRCTFGSDAIIEGSFTYQNATMAELVNGSKGYASSQLHLVTLQYQLFHDLPVDFCGDWLSHSNSNTNTCPGDGKYHFTIPYTLPASSDATTWFATGWKGTARIDIRNGPSNQTDMVGTCIMEFHTYTTQSSNKNWKTLPSAAAVTCTVGGIAVMLFCLICVLGGCIPESKSRRVAVAEPSLTTPLSDADIVDGKFMFQKMEEGKESAQKYTSRWSRLPNYNNLKGNQK